MAVTRMLLRRSPELVHHLLVALARTITGRRPALAVQRRDRGTLHAGRERGGLVDPLGAMS